MATRRLCLSPPLEAPFPGHPARPRLPSRPALPFACWLEDGPDDPYPNDRYPVVPYPFFFVYLFRSTRRQGRAWPSLRGSTALDGTEGRAWPPAYGKWNSVMVARRPGATGHLGRACWPACRPIRICPPCGGTPGRARARERGGRAQEQRPGARSGPQPRRLRHPRSPSWRIDGVVPCACA